MRIYGDIDSIETVVVAGGSLAIGNFDGVHLGHQRLLARARELAAGRPVVAMTFDRHPMAVLNPRQAPQVMTPTPLRTQLLGQAGADVVVILPTTRELLALEPEPFVRQIVVERVRPRAVVEGPDFGFGRGRAGDIDTLRQFGQQFGFEVAVVEPVVRSLPGHHEPVAVSSTLIRRLIAGGAMEPATACLGRPYRLVGAPVSGAGRGRRIGLPTVNVDVGEQLLPMEGIYAGFAHWPKGTRPAAINIGPAPTFGVTQVVVEAHLLDFSGELAAERIELDLIRRLRGGGEVRFGGSVDGPGGAGRGAGAAHNS